MTALFESEWDGQDGSNYGWSAVSIYRANGTDTGQSLGIDVGTAGDAVIPDADIPRLITALQAYIGPPEMAIREQDSDWIRCLPDCNNTPDMDGFASCLPDGTEIEPVGGTGGWDGKLLVCLQCGRIINQDTLEVTGRRPDNAGPDDRPEHPGRSTAARLSRWVKQNIPDRRLYEDSPQLVTMTGAGLYALLLQAADRSYHWGTDDVTQPGWDA